MERYVAPLWLILPSYTIFYLLFYLHITENSVYARSTYTPLPGGVFLADMRHGGDRSTPCQDPWDPHPR